MPVIKNYLSLIKFSHTIFAMPFALIGFFLGINSVFFRPAARQNLIPFLYGDTGVIIELLILVLLCMIFARSAAMAFNRYADRRYDAQNARTAVREIPAGIITPGQALLFTILNCAAFIICTWFINKICFLLSPVALLIILFYSYTKRFTALCHLVLGAGLSLAPIGAWLAVTGVFNVLPVLFSIAVIFWVSGFDVIYALQDEAFDKENELYSIPSFMGKSKALNVSIFLHLLSAFAVVLAGIYGSFGIFYWLGVVVFIGMLLYQHSLVKPNDLSRVNIAFMTANGIASVLFAVLVIADIYI
ncbi:MAG: UbiA family prenyltransferase [Niastella sp.]|nr:UbiA family prenyltransferase [Niastella sp.]